MRRLAGGFAIGLALTMLLSAPAGAHHTNFTGSCKGIAYNGNPVKRTTARNYAYVGNLEGYQWGGGCWDNDNVDDSPGDPKQDNTTNGEGGDCSGFTFKSWYERMDETASGFRYHDAMERQHGPYTAAEFKAGVGAPNVAIATSKAIMMDAFASGTHIGMVYAANVAYNTDDVIEAKGEDYGTRITRVSWRGNTATWGGVTRANWLPECSPQCVVTQ